MKQIGSWANCDAKKALVLRATLAALLLLALGCESSLVIADGHRTDNFLAEVAAPPLGVNPQNLSGAANDKIALEAGIVFANEASYICFPLERLGIEKVESVQRIDSSCECVLPTLVGYADPGGETKAAARLDFVLEGNGAVGSDQPLSQPSLLSVELRFKLAGAEERIFTVNFLHSNQTYEVAAQGRLP